MFSKKNCTGTASPLPLSAINLGSGEKHSLLDIADLVSKDEERVRLPPRKNNLAGMLADTCRAKSLLNFQTSYNFCSEMRNLVLEALAGINYTFASWTDCVSRAGMV